MLQPLQAGTVQAEKLVRVDAGTGRLLLQRRVLLDDVPGAAQRDAVGAHLLRRFRAGTRTRVPFFKSVVAVSPGP